MVLAGRVEKGMSEMPSVIWFIPVVPHAVNMEQNVSPETNELCWRFQRAIPPSVMSVI